uniref:Uracil-DNA glycosylase n=2 Tax=Auxenochlorella protothecoides TaxID=3075 RepID=A0A1D2A5Q9_AUXPR
MLRTCHCVASLLRPQALHRSGPMTHQGTLHAFLGVHPAKKAKHEAPMRSSPPSDPQQKKTGAAGAPLAPQDPALDTHALQSSPDQDRGNRGTPELAQLLAPAWRDLMGDQLSASYFRELEAFLVAEWGGKTPIFPPRDQIFRALNACPIDKVRVVVLGQDPYHGPGQAMGMSFSVAPGVPVPSSLRNIFKELRDDVGCAPPGNGDLSKWAERGVLLLNAVLTVRSGAAASHQKKGWERFTDAVIRTLNRERTGVVYLLWGRHAQAKGALIDRTSNHVLTAAHPSGLSASRGFFGCRHFSAANAWLAKDGQEPIDWQL